MALGQFDDSNDILLLAEAVEHGRSRLRRGEAGRSTSHVRPGRRAREKQGRLSFRQTRFLRRLRRENLAQVNSAGGQAARFLDRGTGGSGETSVVKGSFLFWAVPKGGASEPSTFRGLPGVRRSRRSRAGGEKTVERSELRWY